MLAVGGLGDHPLLAVEATAPPQDGDALVGQPPGDVVGLPIGQLEHALVHRREVDVHHGLGVQRVLAAEPDAELGRLRHPRHHLRGGDQRLGGHAVGEHGRTTQTIGVDQRHLSPELAGDERRFISAGAAADDDYTGHARILPRRHSRSALSVAGFGNLLRVQYAAYGSNLDPTQMTSRCPHSPLRSTGWLTGWRLTFGGDGWDGSLPTLVEDPESQVYVALYDVTESDETTLDSWESADSGLYRKVRVRVATLEGELTAWVYVLNDFEGGLPQRPDPRDPGRRRRGGGRPGRLRDRAALALLRQRLVSGRSPPWPWLECGNAVRPGSEGDRHRCRAGAVGTSEAEPTGPGHGAGFRLVGRRRRSGRDRRRAAAGRSARVRRTVRRRATVAPCAWSAPRPARSPGSSPAVPTSTRAVGSMRWCTGSGRRPRPAPSVIVLTNGCGGLNRAWTPGTPVLIKDHINLTGASPLRGATFIDLTEAYSARLRDIAHEVDPDLPEGVYVQFRGPAYETPAEVRMAGVLGGDLVGMSTTLETVAAREAGLEVLGHLPGDEPGRGHLAHPAQSRRGDRGRAAGRAEAPERCSPGLAARL